MKKNENVANNAIATASEKCDSLDQSMLDLAGIDRQQQQQQQQQQQRRKQ